MKLFCKLPFSRISIDDDGNIWPACCPDWVQFPLGNIFKQTWDEIWLGEAAQKFRASMFDGSLRYCDKGWCPNVADALAGIDNHAVVPLHKAPAEWTPAPPVHVNLNFDQTCNLKCPTCRTELIHMRGEQLQKVQYIQQYAEKQILPTVESIALTGVGDPFMSQVFRNFLINFDSKKYPGIKSIHFHTNAQLFDEEMYRKMPGIHHLKLSTDISIDASDAEVYSKVRTPGNWHRLMKNLKFIKSLDNLTMLGISMVVQQDNYWQMMDFIKLGETLAGNNRFTFVEFKRPRQFYGVTDAMFNKMGIDEMEPAMKADFLKQLQLVERKRKHHAKKKLSPEIRHNLHEYLIPENEDASNRSWLSSMLSSIDIFPFRRSA